MSRQYLSVISLVGMSSSKGLYELLYELLEGRHTISLGKAKATCKSEGGKLELALDATQRGWPLEASYLLNEGTVRVIRLRNPFAFFQSSSIFH